jgi:pyruvate/2-oxoglutarate dehydrogenase complex dihydrolipoamide dehydrogenase (E3) component
MELIKRLKVLIYYFAGASPNTDMLQLENTSINFDEKGYIAVDDYCKTNVDGVFAIGDCNGKVGLHTSLISRL